MGGVFGGGGVGADKLTSPQRAVIEKFQSELRQEYDVREERRRELEFLEKGGDPLEFKLSTASSLSLQSTSVTDQQPYKLVSSEANGSFALAASPHGDSVESNGRPVVRLLCEPDSADNLMLFDGENEFPEVDRSLAHPSKCIFTPSKQSPKLDVQDNSNELKSSAAFNVPRNSYRRRSRPNRDGTKTGSNHAVLARSTSLSSRHPPREVKGLSSDVETQTDETVLVNPNPVSPSQKKGTAIKCSENPSALDDVQATESTDDASKDLINDHDNQQKLLTSQRRPGIVPEDQECAHKKQDLDSAVLECHPCETITKLEDLASRGEKNGFAGSNDNTINSCVDVQNNSVAVASKVLDSESSCTDMGSNKDGCNRKEVSTNQKGTGNVNEHMVVPQVTPVKEEATEIEERKNSEPLDRVVLSDDSNLNNQNQENELQCGAEEEAKINSSILGNMEKDFVAVQSVQVGRSAYSETDIHVTGSGTTPSVTNRELLKSSLVNLPAPKVSTKNSAVTMEKKESNAKAVSKADEDAVLKEAGVIEAKRKRIAALSTAVVPIKNHRKSHWDYVLDEMAWLANDFAQERLWKMTAAAQICRRVAYNSQLRFEEKHHTREHTRVAHLLSEAVIEFWSSVQDSNKDMKLTCPKDSALTLRQYALNFLKFNGSCVQHNQAEAPDMDSALGTMGMSWNDLTEGNLFYMVPSGAMKKYKKSIESHVAHYENTLSSLQEDVDTSGLDAVTAFGASRSAFEEEQGETSTYDSNSSKPLGYAQKKQKILPNGYGRRSYEVGTDLMNAQCMENKLGTHQAVFMGKRPASSLNVSVPTKRVRTASRQRVLSPFTAATPGCVPLASKVDTSSGDTSSFHDDQSTPYDESIMANNLEVESVRDFEKKLQFDSTEVSKPRKKKKQKKLGSAYEQRWQIDSNFQSEQRDHSKKRSEVHQLESNGCGGLLDQHILKKPKVKRPSALDNSFNNILPVVGSVPSPVASQMSNMSKLNIKIIGGGEQGRKTKTSKVPSRQQGSGSPWSQFEDQALIVLVHDMGPNWELVSNTINFTLQFKCIYRKPNECKERHKVLMDKTTGDGADSAEDSGSSQHYPYTLPGIPKGSARQLFQQLQRPVEEETLKSHFEKIITIVQKQHYRKSQNCNTDLILQPHGSHMLALSQVCPNNLNGGPALTPLDLCDQTTSDPDIPSLGYQSPLNNCLPMSNQFSVASLPAPQGPATTMLVGNNFSSSSGSLNPYVRDGRFSIPRSASLSIDEQQRMQQYNQMISGRNIQHPALTTSEPGTDLGTRMLPGGSGMSVMSGANRSGHVARPGFQTMAPSPTSNSGIVKSARDALHMMRPSQSQETQRKILATEIQMRAPQANQGLPPYGGSTFPNQTGVPPMPVASRSLHQQSLPVSSQQTQMLNHRPHFQGANHASNPQHQAHALRLMKERQLQQRIMQQRHHQQQKQQQFVSSNAVLPHGQQPAQLPISTSSLNGSQVRPEFSSSTVPFSSQAASSSLTSVPHQHKLQMPPHGLVRSQQAGGSGLANHVGKPRRQPQHPQAQQFQQAGRHTPEQIQQPPSQQHTKHVKGVGRGNLIQQSTSTDSYLPNGLSRAPGNSSTEKSEQVMHSVKGQGSIQNTKKVVSPNSLSQSQPMCPGQVAQASDNIEIVASHSDNNINMAPVSSVCHQSVASPDTTSSHQQSQLQLKSQQKAVKSNPPAPQSVLQANRQVNCDTTTKLQSRESQSPIEQCNISYNSPPASMERQEGNDLTEGTPVGSSSADQRNASEQLHNSITSTPSSFPSAGTHLADDAGETKESLGYKQSSQKVPSVVSQPQQPTSPVSQLQK